MLEMILQTFFTCKTLIAVLTAEHGFHPSRILILKVSTLLLINNQFLVDVVRNWTGGTDLHTLVVSAGMSSCLCWTLISLAFDSRERTRVVEGVSRQSLVFSQFGLMLNSLIMSLQIPLVGKGHLAYLTPPVVCVGFEVNLQLILRHSLKLTLLTTQRRVTGP